MDADPDRGQDRSPVLLVEDDPLVGRALARQLKSQGLQVEWCETIDASRARLSNASLPVPRTVILDLDLPDGRGEDLLPLISEEAPDCKVVVVSGQLDGPTGTALLLRGVSSIMKPVGAADIAGLILSFPATPIESSAEALETAGDRSSHVRIKGIRQATVEISPPTQRVLEQLLAGKSNQEIADALDCGIKNVEYHIGKLLKVTGYSSRLQLVVGMRARGKPSEV